MARRVAETRVRTNFEKGVNAVSWVLIRFMVGMVPVVLFLNGFTKGDWVQAALFALSVAVGLTPEMLPMIVSAQPRQGCGRHVPEKGHRSNISMRSRILGP